MSSACVGGWRSSSRSRSGCDVLGRRGIIAATLLAASGRAHGETWPAKPIRLIVPMAPSATAEIVARALSRDARRHPGGRQRRGRDGSPLSRIRLNSGATATPSRELARPRPEFQSCQQSRELFQCIRERLSNCFRPSLVVCSDPRPALADEDLRWTATTGGRCQLKRAHSEYFQLAATHWPIPSGLSYARPNVGKIFARSRARHSV